MLSIQGFRNGHPAAQPDLEAMMSLKRSLESHDASIQNMSNPHKKQGGVVLFIALVVLVAMSLAGIAMVRSVDTGSLVAGNMAFKQGATLAGDAGTELAISWLTSAVVTQADYN